MQHTVCTVRQCFLVNMLQQNIMFRYLVLHATDKSSSFRTDNKNEIDVLTDTTAITKCSVPRILIGVSLCMCVCA